MGAEREPDRGGGEPERQPPAPTPDTGGLAPWLATLGSAGQGAAPSRSQVLALQRTAGNVAVRRLLDAVAPSAAPARRTAGRQAVAPAATRTGLIVREGTQPAVGQMTVPAFLADLERALCTTVDEAMAGSPWSVAGCPWIRHWMQQYSQRSAADVEQAVGRDAPGAGTATSAADLIPLVCARVRRDVAAWRESGAIPAEASALAAAGGGAAPAEGPGTGDAARAPGEGAPGPPASAESGVARSASDPAQMRSTLGRGEPLETGLSTRMSRALGADLSHVRVHRDARAVGAVGARAFAVGEHVAFGPGEYEPGTVVGDALIAHELAHVLQQDGSPEVARSVVADDPALERDADATALSAMASLRLGRPAAGHRRGVAGLQLQRCSTTVPEILPGASWETVEQQTRLHDSQEEIADIDRTLMTLRYQAAQEQPPLLSRELFDAWARVNVDFIALQAQSAPAVRGQPPPHVEDALRGRLIEHSQAFYDALERETAPGTETQLVPHVGFVSRNPYTGARSGAGESVVLRDDLIAHLRAGRWTPALRVYQSLVDGLDRWVAHKNRERYGAQDANRPETGRASLGETLTERRRVISENDVPGMRRVGAILRVDPEEGSGQSGPQDVPLSLYYWRDGDSWYIRDFTRPDDPYRWDVHAGSESEPPNALFQELETGPHFPRGNIRWQLTGADGRPGRTGEVQTSGPSPARRWLTYIGLGAAAIGLGLVTFGTGTALVVGGYMLAGSALLGAGMATADLIESGRHGTLTAQRALLDGAQIIASLSGLGALRAGQILNAVRAEAAAGQAARATLGIELASRLSCRSPPPTLRRTWSRSP